MMERVSVRQGNSPILVIAPHGCDDPNTDIVAEKLAENLDAYFVINRGWTRSQQVDQLKSEANCNNVYHCLKNVVMEEFLNPIVKYVNKIDKDIQKRCNLPDIHIFIIHGVGNNIRKTCPSLDFILGCGRVKRESSRTAHYGFRSHFINALQKAGTTPYAGKHGGQYSGSSKANLNQLFKKWYPDPWVQSIQIEIVRELRDNKGICGVTAKALADCIQTTLAADWSKPLKVNIPLC